MSPNSTSSPDWLEFKGHADFAPGDGRSAASQASYQLLALALTLVVAIVGGALVGKSHDSMWSQWSHNVVTMWSQCSHNVVTM